METTLKKDEKFTTTHKNSSINWINNKENDGAN